MHTRTCNIYTNKKAQVRFDRTSAEASMAFAFPLSSLVRYAWAPLRIGSCKMLPFGTATLHGNATLQCTVINNWPNNWMIITCLGGWLDSLTFTIFAFIVIFIPPNRQGEKKREKKNKARRGPRACEHGYIGHLERPGVHKVPLFTLSSGTRLARAAVGNARALPSPSNPQGLLASCSLRNRRASRSGPLCAIPVRVHVYMYVCMHARAHAPCMCFVCTSMHAQVGGICSERAGRDGVEDWEEQYERKEIQYCSLGSPLQLKRPLLRNCFG